MKLYRDWSLIVFALMVCLQIWSHPVSAKIALSNMLLIPGQEPVRIKLPETSHYVEIFSLRAIPEGTEIDFTSSSGLSILCPDLSIRAVSSAEEFACPERSLEVDLVVEVPPAWGVVPPDSTKGDGQSSVDLSADELQRFHEAEEQIIRSAVEEKIKIFLLVNLYASQRLYTQAIERFENELTAQNDPVALRLLGYVYLQAGEPRKSGIAYYNALELSRHIADVEGQALAHHQLALLYQLFENPDEAIQHTQAALDLSQRLGYISQSEVLQQLLRELHE